MTPTDFNADTIAHTIIAWQKNYGRHNLPWQKTGAYACWVSEIMLQQTRVEKVISYYQNFMQRFPSVATLASAPIDDVLALWSGLGYYRRAHNMHRAAQLWHNHYPDTSPQTREQWMSLPGVGRSTAGAVLSLALGKREALCDANVMKVLSRVFAIELKNMAESIKWGIVQALLPEHNVQAYNQGLMDIGATICHKNTPECRRCPLQQQCMYANHPQAPTPNTTVSMAKKTIAMYVGFCFQNKHIAVHQRSVTGIWPKLWFLPAVATVSHPTQVFRHILTHRVLSVSVCTVTEDQFLEPITWLHLDDLQKHAHPSLLPKIIHAFGHRPCAT